MKRFKRTMSTRRKIQNEREYHQLQLQVYYTMGSDIFRYAADF